MNWNGPKDVRPRSISGQARTEEARADKIRGTDGTLFGLSAGDARLLLQSSFHFQNFTTALTQPLCCVSLLSLYKQCELQNR